MRQAAAAAAATTGVGENKFQHQRINSLQQHQQQQQQQQQANNMRTFGTVARSGFFIDTPGRMVRENRFAACNFFTANKVELIDLEPASSLIASSTSSTSSSSTTKPSSSTSIEFTLSSLSTNVAATKSKSTKRCLSLSPQLSLSSSNSSTSSSSSTSPTTSSKESTKRTTSLAVVATTTTSSTTSSPLSTLSFNTACPSIAAPYHRKQIVMSRASATMGGDANNTMTTTTTTTTANTTTYEYLLVDPKKIHLFVKAGQDGRSQGACPFCQDVFLQLLIKAQTNKFNFDVISINLDNPPKEFKELCIKPPVLIHGSTKLVQETTNSRTVDNNMVTSSSSNSSSSSGEENMQTNAVILSDVDEIAEYLDRLYPNSKLTQINPEAKKVCLNVFSKFSFFIRDIASKSTALEAELEKIDTYLRENCSEEDSGDGGDGSCFLNGGTTMTKLDCSLLPKLQHIRVAGESIKKFRIPARFRHLWKYLSRAYETDAFQKSCPPDREIIWHWSKAFLTHKDMLQIMNEAPYKTHTLPPDLNL